jgi:2-C-methyl-D-erythritol 4-phosphate cytidylyltransferase
MKNIAVILAGGVGERVKSSCPKQYILVRGKPIIFYTLKIFAQRNDIDKLVIVADEAWRDFIEEQLKSLNITQPVSFACSGITRQHSVYSALKVLRQDKTSANDTIIIHDAARPCVSNKIIDQCIAGCKEHDGVLPVVPVKDTIYGSATGNTITQLFNRSELWAGQSPESFRFGKYYKIHTLMNDDDMAKVKGCSEIAYTHGLNIIFAKGEESNFKITTAEDLQRFEILMQ